jgi:hypothetical protein
MSNLDFENSDYFAQKVVEAREKLEAWGRWLVSRETMGTGYGQSPLAQFMPRSPSREGTFVPINDLQSAEVDRVVREMAGNWLLISAAYWGQGTSRRAIAKHLRMAVATVTRHINDVERTVAKKVRT